MNQLFDGKGDKMSLAKGNEQHVPANSTCISISVQPQPFCKLWQRCKGCYGWKMDLGKDSYSCQPNHTTNYIEI